MANSNEISTFNPNAKDVELKTRGRLVSVRQGYYSLFCLSEQNVIRRAAKFIVDSRYPFLYKL